MRWLGVVVLAVTGCDLVYDSNCVDGICPVTTGTIAHPGPCRSAASGEHAHEVCRFGYDALGHMTDIACASEANEPAYDAYLTFEQTAHYTFDGDAPIGIEVRRGSTTTIWDLDARPITAGRRTYDAATFRLFDLAGSDRVAPRAELGLVSDGTIDYTWTETPTGRVRHGGETDLDFGIDGEGRVVRISRVDTVDPSRLREIETFDYDGARLTERRCRECPGPDTLIRRDRYDRGDNIIDERVYYTQNDPDEVISRTVYDYTCWGD